MTHFSRGAWLCVLLPAGPLICGCGRSQAPPGPPPPPEVSVSVPVTRIVTDYEDFPGRIEAKYAVEIRARVNGYLKKVNFVEGAEVKEGDLLFEIDPRPYQAELARAEGSVIQGNGRLQRLELEHRRAVDLRRTKATSQEDLDKVIGDRTEAVGALEVAKASREMAQLNLEFTKVQAPLSGRISRRFLDPGNMVKADETALTTIVSLDPVYAYFDLDERSTLRAQRMLREKTIAWSPTSPLPLFLGLADEEKVCSVRVWVDPKKAAARALTVAAVIEALHKLQDVRATGGLPNSVAPPGQQVELTLSVPARLAVPERVERFVLKAGAEGRDTLLKDVARVERGARNMGYPRRGEIDFADNRVDSDTGTWRLRATFKNTDHALYPGLYVRIRLPLGKPHEATLVSPQALGTDQGQQFLYVLKPGKDKQGKTISTADYRRVKVGRLHNGLRAITEGLAANEKVIVSGLQRVRPGIEIRPEVVDMPILTDPEQKDGKTRRQGDKETRK